ncbi:hypothetical protein BH11VER1_BH11VER1_12100 [soil metagenome]
MKLGFTKIKLLLFTILLSGCLAALFVSFLFSKSIIHPYARIALPEDLPVDVIGNLLLSVKNTGITDIIINGVIFEYQPWMEQAHFFTSTPKSPKAPEIIVLPDKIRESVQALEDLIRVNHNRSCIIWFPSDGDGQKLFALGKLLNSKSISFTIAMSNKESRDWGVNFLEAPVNLFIK